jgi:hypothetical protein
MSYSENAFMDPFLQPHTIPATTKADPESYHKRIWQIVDLECGHLDSMKGQFLDDLGSYRAAMLLAAVLPRFEEALLKWEPLLVSRHFAHITTLPERLCWFDGVHQMHDALSFSLGWIRIVDPRESLEHRLRWAMKTFIWHMRTQYGIGYDDSGLQTVLGETDFGSLKMLANEVDDSLPESIPEYQGIPVHAEELLPFVQRVHPTAIWTNKIKSGAQRFTYKDRSEPCFATGMIHEGTNGFFAWKDKKGAIRVKCMSDHCKHKPSKRIS